MAARSTIWHRGCGSREAALVSAGWRVLRFDAYVVLFAPARIVAEVRAELAAAE